jgi:hypothetical protein
MMRGENGDVNPDGSYLLANSDGLLVKEHYYSEVHSGMAEEGLLKPKDLIVSQILWVGTIVGSSRST